MLDDLLGNSTNTSCSSRGHFVFLDQKIGIKVIIVFSSLADSAIFEGPEKGFLDGFFGLSVNNLNFCSIDLLLLELALLGIELAVLILPLFGELIELPLIVARSS